MKRRRALLLTLMVVLALSAACGVWLPIQRKQYARNRQLIFALEHGDTKNALTLVNAGADPNTRYAPSPVPSFKFLLDYLLHHTPPANNSPTAFMLTCGMGWDPTTGHPISSLIIDEDLPLLRAMLAHGANVHARAFRNNTALHTAVAENQLHTVELLLEHCANPNAQDMNGYTPLMYNTYSDTVNATRLLLTHGTNPNAQKADNQTASPQSLQANITRQILRELLAHGANPNQRDKIGLTPLQFAQDSKRFDLADLMRHSGR